MKCPDCGIEMERKKECTDGTCYYVYICTKCKKVI
jgi:hypothetical protein